MRERKLFFATDLHGSERCFLKFVNAGKFYDVDTLVLGGDVTGKMIVSIVRQPNGTFESDYLGVKRVLKTTEEVQRLDKTIRDTGYYPYVTDVEEVQKLSSDPERVRKLFTELMIKGLERWIKLAEERLGNTGKQMYITGGNDDPLTIEPVLRSSHFVINPEDKVVQIDEHHEMISSGHSNITPWHAPRDIPEEELAEKIDKMASQIRDMKNCIFNLHCPPYNSEIDVAPELDKDLRPVQHRGGVSMIPVGSRAVRRAIEKYQPILGLHGHIHESAGTYKINRTLCVNPGSEYAEGILKGVIVTLNEKGIKSYFFTSG